MSQGLRLLLSWTASTGASDHSDAAVYNASPRPCDLYSWTSEPSGTRAGTAQNPGVSARSCQHSQQLGGATCSKEMSTGNQDPGSVPPPASEDDHGTPQAVILQYHSRTDVGILSDCVCDTAEGTEEPRRKSRSASSAAADVRAARITPLHVHLLTGRLHAHLLTGRMRTLSLGLVKV